MDPRITFFSRPTTSSGLSNSPAQLEVTDVSPTTSSKVVTSVTEKTRSTISSDKWTNFCFCYFSSIMKLINNVMEIFVFLFSCWTCDLDSFVFRYWIEDYNAWTSLKASEWNKESKGQETTIQIRSTHSKMGDFMVPVSQNEQSGEIINTNPSQTGHTTLPLPERAQNLYRTLQSELLTLKLSPEYKR